jgi:hypothetical protein
MNDYYILRNYRSILKKTWPDYPWMDLNNFELLLLYIDQKSKMAATTGQLTLDPMVYFFSETTETLKKTYYWYIWPYDGVNYKV